MLANKFNDTVQESGNRRKLLAIELMKQVKSELMLTGEITLPMSGNFQAKEVMNNTKILNLELTIKKKLKDYNSAKLYPANNISST